MARQEGGGAAGEGDGEPDVLRRMAAEIRGTKGLEALLPLSAAERMSLVEAAMAEAAKAEVAVAEKAEVAKVATTSPAVSAATTTATNARRTTSAIPTLVAEGGSASVPVMVMVAQDELARRRSRRFATRILGGALAVAVAVLLVVRLLPDGGGGKRIASLPSYGLRVEGERQTRGEPAAAASVVEARPGTRLTLTLTPERLERDALTRLLLVRDGAAVLLEPSIRRGKDGVQVVEALASELLGAQVDGDVELVVILGRELPSDEQIRALALGRGVLPRHLQLLRQPLRLSGFSHSSIGPGGPGGPGGGAGISIEVLLGGCRAVHAGAGAGAPPRCEVAGAPLRLWLGVTAADPVQIFVDDQALAIAGVARGGGLAFTLPVPATARSLTVRRGSGVGAGVGVVAAWEIFPSSASPRLAPLAAAIAEQRYEQAAAELSAVEAATSVTAVEAPAATSVTASPATPASPATATAALSPAEQLELVQLRAKLAARQGEVGKSRAARRQAVELARRQGNISAEDNEAVAILYGLIDEHAFAEATQLLAGFSADQAVYAEGAMYREMARGRLATELGDPGVALGAQRRAYAIAERLSDERTLGMIRPLLGDVLESLGREGEMAELAEAEIARGSQAAEACARVDALTSAGWLLRQRDGRRAQLLADQAVALAGKACPTLSPIALVNRGWLLAAAARFEEARGVLAQLDRSRQPSNERHATWALRIQAEIVLGEDPAAAERQAQGLAQRAAAACSTEQAYEAQLLRARALAAQDRSAQATAAFAEAERTLALWSRLVPLGEGRATFFQRHDQLAFAAISFFLEEARRGDGQARRALAATVRRSLARFTASLAHSAGAGDGGGGGGSSSGGISAAGGADVAGAGSTAASPAAAAGLCALRDLAAQRAEERPLSEPPANASLFVHPLQRGGWLLLAWRGDSIDFVEVAEPAAAASSGGAARAARLASAAAPLLAGAPRISLYVHRAAAALPLDRAISHALALAAATAARGGGKPAASASLSESTNTSTLTTSSSSRIYPSTSSTISSTSANRGALAPTPASTAPASLGPVIAFAVDAPEPRRAASACAGAPRALLVTNPQRNLWAASESAPIIRAHLEARGFRVDVLEGAAVTRSSLEARLADPCTALFHYDGHAAAANGAAPAAAGGAAPAAAGGAAHFTRDRVDDALLLAGGATMTAAEVLGLARVPRAIVLNGCTTAAPEGLGLAQAFLAAGAEQVIASLDEVAAAAAADFTRRLFQRAAGEQGAADLSLLFARAIAAAEVPQLRAFER